MKLSFDLHGSTVTWENGWFEGDSAAVDAILADNDVVIAHLSPTGPHVMPEPFTPEGALAMALIAGATLTSEPPKTMQTPVGIDGPNFAIRKHMGPGPHPSGSSQDVHGGTGRGTATRTRAKIFYADNDSPRHFIYTWERKFGEEAHDWDWEVKTLTAEHRERFERAAQAALDMFNQAYPGVLPEETSFVVVPEKHVYRLFGNGGTAAFVDTLDRKAKVIVNEGWITGEGRGDPGLTYREMLDQILAQPERQIIGVEVEKLYGDPDLASEVTLFHELAHIADNFSGYTDSERGPRYSQEWYSLPDILRTPEDPLHPIPSRYAASNPKEFFAEALSDYHYMPQPRKHSVETHDIFYSLFVNHS